MKATHAGVTQADYLRSWSKTRCGSPSGRTSRSWSWQVLA